MTTSTNILIDNTVYQKIMHWINKSDYEVSGLGKITYKDGTITVIDAILLPQKNGRTHTDIEGDVVGKAMFQMKDTPGDLRWWWHSHVDMAVFWSGTDTDTIAKISAGGWFVSTVFNKKHEMRSCLNMVSPVPIGMIDNIPTQPIQFIDQNLIDQWDKDYEDNVENLMRSYQGAYGGHTYTPPEVSRFRESQSETGEPKQLSLMARGAFSEPETTAADDYFDTPEGDAQLRRMTHHEVQEYLRRRGKFPRRGGPPSDINGKTGGW